MIRRTLSLIATVGLMAMASASAMTVASEHIGSVPILLGTESVRKELKLNSLQKAVLDSLRGEYKSAARKLADPLPTTTEERAAAEAKLQALNVRYNNRALSVLNDWQKERFLELEHQALGALHLYSPKVQKKLSLTPAQAQKIEQIRQKGLVFVGKVNRQFEEGKIGYQERLSILEKRRKADQVALLKVLTPSQQAAFNAMGGKKPKAS